MSRTRGRRGKLSLLALGAATYCMVSGGPYGLEEIVGKAGYLGALIMLIVTPLIWSVPTALMVSELAGAIPAEGGFYVWVRRAMGPFWGFQEGWLTLAGSAFDMAIYPTLFAWYLARLFPALGAGPMPLVIGSAMILGCVAWNLCSVRTVGRGTVWLTIVILAPFVAIVGLAVARTAAVALPRSAGQLDLVGGILIAMWNYMGWDNASTFAEEVEAPRTAYPRIMLISVALVTLGYVIPVAALAGTGIAADAWVTAGWVDVARMLGGAPLAAVVTVTAALATVATFNALTLSLSRLPVAMANDGWLPAGVAYRHPVTGAPVVSIVCCAVTWLAALQLGFDRIVTLDVMLSGLSMLLEFWALVVLRVREPSLRRPFRIPGGLFGAVAVGICPAVLIGLSGYRGAEERIGPFSSLLVGGLLIALGPVFYGLSRRRPRPAR